MNLTWKHVESTEWHYDSMNKDLVIIQETPVEIFMIFKMKLYANLFWGLTLNSSDDAHVISSTVVVVYSVLLLEIVRYVSTAVFMIVFNQSTCYGYCAYTLWW